MPNSVSQRELAPLKDFPLESRVGLGLTLGLVVTHGKRLPTPPGSDNSASTVILPTRTTRPSNMPDIGPEDTSMTTGAHPRRFPDDFVWGAATSAYQIEGAAGEDSRGASIWDAFARTPGMIDDGTTGDVSIDHYHRYRDDVRLLKEIGTMAYRFSIAWPRVFPDGTGAPNPNGLAFYDRLVDELLARGIEPYATLYHWDLPQALQERVGGWQSRDTPLAFADYAAHVAEKLSDRVKNFFTINEFYSFVEFGYGTGVNAPGLKLPPARLIQVRHHAVLGHGLATQAIRARAKPGTRVGPVDNITVAVPAIETEDNIAQPRSPRETSTPRT